MAQRMPAVFFGHGNPMNALDDNAWTRGWSTIAASTPRPKAILAISAHWYLPGTHVTAMPHPRTIHDFGGFPHELYEVRYPAPGDRGLAERVRDLLVPVDVRFDEHWGLDHGTWSVLVHAYPDADVPVVQLALDETHPPSYHYELGRRLAPLRDEGVLIAGSGNVVHNLHAYAWGRHPAQQFEWAVRFEDRARELLAAGDHEPLIDYESLGRDAMLSVPTPEHYLPLLYVIATQQPGDAVTYPVEGGDGGSISMLSVRVG
ncbi:MAG TPA: 4,5-DOPA dioxygenase extradiol [Candidatus Elarobacter sp.]|jgi:4,5-DOPA dioxygenase extradiol|nr:4,5-DOPA dioxygenase extradiol [Candidatus Elarobacter sp.]